MLRPPAPAHYLRANHAEWAPRAVLFLDTESRTMATDRGDLEVLRLWAGHYLDRVAPKHAAPRDEWADGDTATELAAWITSVTRNRESVWIFAHNLSFDLTTTRLPLELVKAGWEVGDAAVGGKAPWMRLRRGKRVLTLTDSYSWIPRPLEEVGRMVGLAKPELPARDDGRDWWLARCRADVEIMERAILSIMAWWGEHQLGRWNISGPSCGWNAFRHKPSPERILIDPLPTITREERKAYHGGRRGTWSIGDHAAGPFVELDFTAAYPTVAATLPLPVGRAYPFPSLPLTDPVLSSDRWGVIARVLVQTDVPRWPVRTAGGTWYPVGRFWTHLAGPDIREAARLGCLLQVGEGWVHRLGMAMAPWARWVLDVQNGRDDTAPEVARVLAKEWGRTVIGKWGARSFEKIKLGPAPTDGWGYEEGWNHSVDAHCGMVDLAGQRWLVTSSAEGDNAYPAIPAWVESEVRCRLNRVIEALGPAAVLQCDTDGLIVAERIVGTVAAHGHLVAPPSVPPRGRLDWCLDQIDPVAAPLTLRVKRRLSHVTVLGPQHVIRDGVRRFAGLPGMAERLRVCPTCGTEEGGACECGAELVTAADRFKVKLWPKLQWQMANGDPRGYLRPEVRPVVKGPWPTGWVLSDNRVVPVETKLDDAGRVTILPWWSTSYARAGLAPAELQHPRLAPLG